MSKNDHTPKRRLLQLTEYVPGSERHSADYEQMLRHIIDGPLSNVEPINGSLTSLVRSAENAGTERAENDDG